jgi:hypothetical protein
MSIFRWRLRFTFWLDLNKPDEAEIAEHITELKEKRSFASTIRDGIRLVYDLRHGRTEVLQELFPWVLEQHTAAQRMTDDAPRPATEELFEQWLERMEDMLTRQGAIPIEGGKLSRTPIPMGDFEMPDLEIKQARRDENNNSTWNFLLASAANVFGNYDGLAPEIIEYGVRTGRIPTDKIPKAKAVMPKVAAAPKGTSGNAKAMLVPQFAAPDLDDLDFDLPIVDVHSPP